MTTMDHGAVTAGLLRHRCRGLARAGVAACRRMRLRAWLGAALCLALPAIGAELDLERIDALERRAEEHLPTALAELVALQSQIQAAPYAVQRHYWWRRIAIESEAGDNDAARVSAGRLDNLSLNAKDPVGQLIGAGARSGLLLNQGKTLEAATLQRDAAPLAKTVDDPAALAYYYRSVGNLLLTTGKFEQSLAATQKSLEYAERQERGAVNARLASLNNLSNVYAAMSNPKKALELLAEAQALAQMHGANSMLVSLYINAGGAHAQLDDLAAYAAANEKALAMALKLGLGRSEATVRNNIADALLRQRDYPRAESAARLAIDAARRVSDAISLSSAQANLGFARMGQGRTAEGVRDVREAIGLCIANEDLAGQEGVLGELSHMYEQQGLAREALATVREQQAVSSTLYGVARERAVALAQEEFEADKRERQLELMARTNSLQESELQNSRLQRWLMALGSVAVAMAAVFVFQLYRRVRESNRRLLSANEMLAFQSVRDTLTGLFNRRFFQEHMKQRGETPARDTRHPDGLFLIDVDHFKQINDAFGHAAGDEVLVEVARRLRDTVRDTDFVMRWGGEEFLVYSPRAGIEQMQRLAGRLLNAIGDTPIAAAGRTMRVTASGGFIALPLPGVSEDECDWEKSLHLADLALYLGKVRGRNRAYGVARLRLPIAESLPLVEHDFAAAHDLGTVSLLEVSGPEMPDARQNDAGANPPDA